MVNFIIGDIGIEECLYDQHLGSRYLNSLRNDLDKQYNFVW